MDVEPYLTDAGVPADRTVDFLDARDLPPPQPLTETMNRLAESDDGSVFVQLNDRAPKFLYPKLAERGFEYRTLDADDGVVTVVWRP